MQELDDLDRQATMTSDRLQLTQTSLQDAQKETEDENPANWEGNAFMPSHALAARAWDRRQRRRELEAEFHAVATEVVKKRDTLEQLSRKIQLMEVERERKVKKSLLFLFILYVIFFNYPPPQLLQDNC